VVISTGGSEKEKLVVSLERGTDSGVECLLPYEWMEYMIEKLLIASQLHKSSAVPWLKGALQYVIQIWQIPPPLPEERDSSASPRRRH
jgi:hypothetical protein